DRTLGGELGVDERARQRDQSANSPRSDNENRGRDLLGDNIRVDKDPRTDDSTHHNHRGIEQAETPREMSFGRRFRHAFRALNLVESGFGEWRPLKQRSLCRAQPPRWPAKSESGS